MSALFIGRFQPFHLGHLTVVQKAVQENDHLSIGIGSSQANFRPENPFTAGERFQMVNAALQEAGIPRDKYSIIPVPNIKNWALWPEHIQTYFPPFNKLYTGSETVKALFQGRNKSIEIVDITKEVKTSSTEIRELMVEGKQWDMLVPKSVAALIEKWGGVDRLSSIQEQTR